MMTLRVFICGRQPRWLDRVVRGAVESRTAPADLALVVIGPGVHVDLAALTHLGQSHRAVLAVATDVEAEEFLCLPVNAVVTVAHDEPRQDATRRIAQALAAIGVRMKRATPAMRQLSWLMIPRRRLPARTVAVSSSPGVGLLADGHGSRQPVGPSK